MFVTTESFRNLSKNTIPFLDVGYTYRTVQDEIDAAVSRVLQSGQYIGGDEVSLFESRFAQFVEASHCVGVANGLDAITLSLRALGVGPGDEVIVPSHTFIATWLAVSETGATPVPVDTAPNGFNLDIDRIPSAITPRTRGIIVVHLYGVPVDLDKVADVATTKGLWVIEDAAQAHGARYKGRRIGAHSALTTWSFYPGKNLGAFGDAGAITTDDAQLADAVRLMGNYGAAQKYEHKVLGVNSRLDPLQAAVLDVKLRYLESWNQRRSDIARTYCEQLAGIDDLELPLFSGNNSWHLFVIRSNKREALRMKLEQSGIGYGVHYPKPPHRQEPYRDGHSKTDLSVTDWLSTQVLSLPIGPHLDDESVEYVIHHLRQTLK